MKPTLLFVYDHKYPEMWLDGLSSAVDLLEEDFEVTRKNIHFIRDIELTGYDFVLGWGAFGSEVDKALQTYGGKNGLCIAGNATSPEGANSYTVLFYETDWIKDNYLPDHPHAIKAFGVNTDIFSPLNIPTPLVWDYIGVGAFASWKRWDKMEGLKGNRLVIGEYQKGNEQESLSIARNLIINGVMVSDMVSPYDLANLYHYSRTLFMPSSLSGGGERAVLEARSCGLSVRIEEDNPKLKELVEMEGIPSHFDYAKALKDGILSVI